jgi:hypothetical protein
MGTTVANSTSLLNLLGTTVSNITTRINLLGTTVANTTSLTNLLGTTVNNLSSSISLLGTTVANTTSFLNLLGTTVSNNTTRINFLGITSSNTTSLLNLLGTTISNSTTQINFLGTSYSNLQSTVATIGTTSNSNTTRINQIGTSFSGYLPLTGGTLTGNVVVTGAVSVGGVFSLVTNAWHTASDTKQRVYYANNERTYLNNGNTADTDVPGYEFRRGSNSQNIALSISNAGKVNFINTARWDVTSGSNAVDISAYGKISVDSAGDVSGRLIVTEDYSGIRTCRVGINNPSPSYNLDLNGTARVSGDMYPGGKISSSYWKTFTHETNGSSGWWSTGGQFISSSVNHGGTLKIDFHISGWVTSVGQVQYELGLYRSSDNALITNFYLSAFSNVTGQHTYYSNSFVYDYFLPYTGYYYRVIATKPNMQCDGNDYLKICASCTPEAR